MDFSRKKAIWNYINEEKTNINLPGRLSFGDYEHDCHLTSAGESLPLGAKSPWTRSPMQTSPAPSLHHHCLASLHRHEGNVLSIGVSRNIIFTGSKSSRIHAWNQSDCTERGCFKAKVGEIRAILAYGRFLFTTHGDYKIRVWEMSLKHNFGTKKITTLPQKRSFFSFPRKSIYHHKDHISCMAYNNVEKLLYTGSWDKTVKAWNVLDRICVDSFVAHEGHVNAIVVNQQDGFVFTCSTDYSVKIWRRVWGESSHILTMTLKFQPSPVNALALSVSTSGCVLYSGSSDGLINFWVKEKMSGRFNHGGFLQAHNFSVLCLVCIGDLVISGSDDATIRIWRREEGNSSHTYLVVIDGHRGPVSCLAASFKTEDTVMGLLVYSASLDQTFKVWRVKLYSSEKANLAGSSANDKSVIEECEMSPVLSPSWVQKKIHTSHFQ